MRRVFLFLLAACLLFLPGCSSGTKPIAAKDIDFVFSCKADVTTSAGNYLCAVNREGRSDASVEILTGAGSGMKWCWNGNSFCQTYCGLTAESGTCTLQKSSFASILVRVLDCAEIPGALQDLGGGSFSGRLEDCTFTLTADGQSEKIQSVSVPDWDFKAQFHDYSEPALKTEIPFNH